MAKKISSERQFVETCKLYLSSISARSCQYAYFNLCEDRDTIILSNSSTATNSHGDRLMDFGIGELGVHIVHFKDHEFIDRLRELVQVPETGLFCVLVSNLVNIVSKYSLDKLESFISSRGFHVLVDVSETIDRDNFNTKSVVGFPIHNFHIESVLKRFYLDSLRVGTDEHKTKDPYAEFDMPLDVHVTKRVYFFEFDLKDFRYLGGERPFKESTKMRFMSLDGITSPSIQDFIKKLSGTPFTLRVYLWAVRGDYVVFVTRFDNDVINSISLRPNLIGVVMPKDMPIEPDLLLTSEMETSNDGSE